MRPADFSATCQGNTGTLPPPHYYEYVIRIGPGPEGMLEMTAGYPGQGTPVWQERFPLGPEHLDWLHDGMAGQGMFSAPWRTRPDVPIGGGSERLAVVAGGQQFTLPPFVDPTQEAAASSIRGAVRALLPPGLWETMNARREAYVRQAVPETPLIPSTGGLASGPLFSDGQVTAGTFLATPLAAAIMMRMNGTRLGRPVSMGVVGFAVVFAAAEIYLNLAVKAAAGQGAGVLSLLLAGGVALVMRVIVNRTQGAELAAHFRAGGARASFGATLMVILVAFAILVAVIFAALMLLAR